MKINDGIKKLLILYILTVICMFSIQGRDKTQVIVYRCPGYTAVQVIHLLVSMKTYLQHKPLNFLIHEEKCNESNIFNVLFSGVRLFKENCKSHLWTRPGM